MPGQYPLKPGLLDDLSFCPLKPGDQITSDGPWLLSPGTAKDETPSILIYSPETHGLEHLDRKEADRRVEMQREEDMELDKRRQMEADTDYPMFVAVLDGDINEQVIGYKDRDTEQVFYQEPLRK